MEVNEKPLSNLETNSCEDNKTIKEEDVKPKCDQELNIKEETEIKPKSEQDITIKEEADIKQEKEHETNIKIEEQQSTNEIIPEPQSVSQEPQSEEMTDEKKQNDAFKDLEIPDTMEVIQVTEVLPPILIDEPSENNHSPLPVVQDIVPEEIKPKSPSPVSTMTCSIDGNTDTEWNVPVVPATGTIKINISQKVTTVAKSITPAEDTSVDLQSPPDFTPTFGDIDPDQPPPPGIEIETVAAPKPQRDMKPRLMHNAKKLKEYPMVNKGKEMSGLCSIM